MLWCLEVPSAPRLVRHAAGAFAAAKRPEISSFRSEFFQPFDDSRYSDRDFLGDEYKGEGRRLSVLLLRPVGRIGF